MSTSSSARCVEALLGLGLGLGLGLRLGLGPVRRGLVLAERLSRLLAARLEAADGAQLGSHLVPHLGDLLLRGLLPLCCAPLRKLEQPHRLRLVRARVRGRGRVKLGLGLS